MKLIIGNRNYSSWSLRAWLLLAASGLEFDEARVLLSVETTAGEIRKYSQAGKVPVLHDGDLVVWDSIAICEYVSERYLEGGGWPKDVYDRAVARACAAEMHSGFYDLRKDMPMNCRATDRKVAVSENLQRDIFRIDRIWTEMRTAHGDKGPYLFGGFSIADCMFAPVVFRFRTYNVSVSAESRMYMETMLSHPKMEEWLKAAEIEEEIIFAAEVGKSFV